MRAKRRCRKPFPIKEIADWAIAPRVSYCDWVRRLQAGHDYRIALNDNIRPVKFVVSAGDRKSAW